MERLTVIIPFLNEKDEINNTLESIRNTAGYNVDIILINDASTDGYDYETIAIKYKVKYIFNKQRKGVAKSRDIGVELLETKYFLIVDGHMRFYNNNWWNIIIDNLKQEERALYCCKCKPIDMELKLINSPSWGAYLDLEGKENPSTILSPHWVRCELNPTQNMVVIPCVLGACYAASKPYWTYLKGLSGLQMYGSDEAYISIKVWLEGGNCILIKNVEIGHIFRDRFPYYVDYSFVIFNKLLISETLFPNKYKYNTYNIVKNTAGICLKTAMELLTAYSKEIMQLRKYYKKISTRTFDSFVEFNENIKKENNSFAR
ncbi:MAG: glycosyltransferase [Dysgonamonadaceae bacterium]|jgi:glycosyltransferase involved in cell wall biosynthesis|nr:glycosyltransferase [Dysgonamonadaceae bacterium]